MSQRLRQILCTTEHSVHVALYWCVVVQVLVLRGTSLTSSAIAVLASKISERLCTLDLADNKLDEAAMQQLVQGKWLKLQSLNLSDNSVNDADIEHLVKGSCPKMDTLLVERTCITLCGMQRLFAAQWPCRESLVVTTTYSPSTAQSKLLQECMAYKYVVIKSDTDFTSFTTGNQAAENKCFTTCTRRFRNNLLGRRAW